MITKREYFGCTIYNNFIYAVGGRDDLNELSSVERYDPSTNQWYNCESLNFARSRVSFSNCRKNKLELYSSPSNYLSVATYPNVSPNQPWHNSQICKF